MGRPRPRPYKPDQVPAWSQSAKGNNYLRLVQGNRAATLTVFPSKSGHRWLWSLHVDGTGLSFTTHSFITEQEATQDGLDELIDRGFSGVPLPEEAEPIEPGMVIWLTYLADYRRRFPKQSKRPR